MPLIVYGIERSPPLRSVLLTAKALGLEVEVVTVELLTDEHKTEDFLKKNPVHTVPVIDDNGFILSDSHAIMVYLMQQYGKDHKLYPNDIKKRALIDCMLYFDASVLAPSGYAYLMPQLYQGLPPNPENEAVMAEKIGTLNTILGQRPYAAGDQISIADFSLINTLTFPAVVRNFKLDAYPNITKWMDKMKSEVPFFEEVSKKGLQELKAFAQQQLGRQ